MEQGVDDVVKDGGGALSTSLSPCDFTDPSL